MLLSSVAFVALLQSSLAPRQLLELSLQEPQSVTCVMELDHGQYQVFRDCDGSVELWALDEDLSVPVGPGLTRQAWMGEQEQRLLEASRIAA